MTDAVPPAEPPLPASEEPPPMEIHKPKPIHGWRDFLKEVGIIVLGVSIALAGEQAVEHWRQHQQYMDNRRAVRTELGLAIASLSHRSEFVPRLEQRLGEVTALLDRAEAGQPIATPHWIGSPDAFLIRTIAESNLDRSDLFPTDEQQIYGLEYAFLREVSQFQDQEKLAWSHLQPLEGRTRVPPEMINSMRADVGEARMYQDRIRKAMDWFRIFEKRYDAPKGVLGEGLAQRRPKAWSVCLPMGTPREEGDRMSFGYLETH